MKKNKKVRPVKRKRKQPKQVQSKASSPSRQRRDRNAADRANTRDRGAPAAANADSSPYETRIERKDSGSGENYEYRKDSSDQKFK